MALKKSQLYSSLWQSWDELRGGMDASQYKDYVLTLLFMKYVSDKYAGKPGALIEVPKGGGFADMMALKGDKEIGDKINNLKASDIETAAFQMPHLAEQQAIATVLSDMDSEIAALEARCDKTRAIKQGMMQQLLTGRVRLVRPAPTPTAV
jgi:type I restriction-modification system DNA methylase subunit